VRLCCVCCAGKRLDLCDSRVDSVRKKRHFLREGFIQKQEYSTLSRTTEIPRSSDAFNSSTRSLIKGLFGEQGKANGGGEETLGFQQRHRSGSDRSARALLIVSHPNSSRETARMVDVLPVPGGP
jgi:hypothetical protein